MKNKTLDFSIMKEEISQNNVLEMAELIAFMELRFQIGYLGSRVQKMYSDLYGDIKHKNELGYMLSDSYDLVQEGALYLCEHYGKHLSDVIGYSKKGKPNTIEIACIRKMMKLINRKTSDYHRSVSLEALTPISEPSCEIKEEVSQDYTLYEKNRCKPEFDRKYAYCFGVPSKRLELSRNRQSFISCAGYGLRILHQNAPKIHVNLRIRKKIVYYINFKP